MDFFLKSQRLGFREWRKSDFAFARELWSDFEVTKFIDARGKLNDDQIREKLNREIETAKASSVQYWPIFLLSSEEFIGCCGLRPYIKNAKILEIGFHICRRHWGNGYAAEAARAVVRYAFQDLGYRTLFAGHNPGNHASRNLLLKLGFSYTHDEFYKPTGLKHPSYVLKSSDFLN